MQLSDKEFRAFLEGKPVSAALKKCPFDPLDSPGIPPAGRDFRALVEALSAETFKQYALNKAYWRALYTFDFSLPVTWKTGKTVVTIVPGHWWDATEPGPRVVPFSQRGRVLILGKMPGHEETVMRHNWAGKSGEILLEALEEAGFTKAQLKSWYVCNLVRWWHPQLGRSPLPAAWITECLPLLYEELRILRPDYILGLGAEATKFLCDNKLSDTLGRVHEFQFFTHRTGSAAESHTAKVLTSIHPAYVLSAPEARPQLLQVLKDFRELINTGRCLAKPADIRWHIVRDQATLAGHINSLLAQPGLKAVAVDAEWQGQLTPRTPGSYLRSVQVCARDDFAIVIPVHDTQGQPCFQPNVQAVADELNRLFTHPEVQIIGHYFAADIPWLEHLGIAARQKYQLPQPVSDWQRANYAGGFDTALALHACDETADLTLLSAAMRYVQAFRWDTDLQAWKTEYCRTQGLAISDLAGYGACPDDILFPYAAYDVIYTRRLYTALTRVGGLLDADRNGLSSWGPFYLAMAAYPAFIEMHCEGVGADAARLEELARIYTETYNVLLQAFREQYHWPTFNPSSSPQCIEFLFGERFSKKRDPQTGVRLPVRPPGAVSLYLTPLKTTDKPPRSWREIQERGLEEQATPSTDKETCGILAAQHPGAQQLRDLRLLQHAITYVLRPPAEQRLQGLAAYITNGRIHSTFYPTLETGRASSVRPALQNLSKRREEDYQRILGERYRWPLRSFLLARPRADGQETLLVEADFIGAELFMLAVQSGDTTMIDHCLRARYPEDDPRHYDIHSQLCVKAFKLNCAPTKQALKAAGKSHLRTAAKATIFARNYGGSAESITRNIQEEGTQITLKEVERLLEVIDQLYPATVRYRHECESRVEQPGWIASCFGRFRRFPPTNDPQLRASYQRSAANFPIQAGVADAMNLGLWRLLQHPERSAIGYTCVLFNHDAIVLEVPISGINKFCQEVLPACLCVEIYRCNLDGLAIDDKPYLFALDCHVCQRWGIPLSEEEQQRWGISLVNLRR